MKQKPFRPLLAVKLDHDQFDELTFPVIVSAKIDGVRCVVKDGVAYSRSMKPLRNRYIQGCLGRDEFNGFDGEITVGDPTDVMCFRTTNSMVSRIDSQPTFIFRVFDDHTHVGPYKDRLQVVNDRLAINTMFTDKVQALPYNVVETVEQLLAMEAVMVGEGYEGIMVRSMHGLYKHGRATFNEQNIFKVKRFVDFEAIICGFNPRLQNENEAETNIMGLQHRSHSKVGIVELDTLGALVVKDVTTGTEFTVGSGLNDLLRKQIWNNKDIYMGKLITYKVADYGGYDAPRFPTFKGFRDPDDMSLD